MHNPDVQLRPALPVPCFYINALVTMPRTSSLHTAIVLIVASKVPYLGRNYCRVSSLLLVAS